MIQSPKRVNADRAQFAWSSSGPVNIALIDDLGCRMLKHSRRYAPLYHDANKKLTNWWGKQNAAPLKFDPKLSEVAFSVFPNFDKCRPEIADDVIFGEAVD